MEFLRLPFDELEDRLPLTLYPSTVVGSYLIPLKYGLFLAVDRI